VAEAGADRTVFTSGDEAALEIDATSSMAFGGRDIVQYQWDKKKDYPLHRKGPTNLAHFQHDRQPLSMTIERSPQHGI